MSSLALKKPPICHNDWMPSTAGGFLAFTIGLVLLIKACGFVLAVDKAVIFTSHDWIYHSFWLPLHLLLARSASGIFARHIAAAKADLRPELRAEFMRRAKAVTSLRGLLGALCLVAPLAYLDLQAGIEFVDTHFATQGYGGAMVPLMWMLEWLATAQIWLYVLGSIYITPLVSSAVNLRGRHTDVLLHGKGRESILAGLENALVILVYGISTIGYVWFADGQLSDYLVLGFSTLLVLICFFSALLLLRAALRENLDICRRDFVGPLDADAASPAAVPFQFLLDSTDGLYTKRASRHQAVEAKIRLLKLAACLPLTSKDDVIAKARADELRLLIECEVCLSEMGVGEIRSLSMRAGMPILAIAGKSLAGALGVH